MKRRDFMISAPPSAAGMIVLPKMAFAEANRIDWYTSSDQTSSTSGPTSSSRSSRPPIPASPSTSSTAATAPACRRSTSAPSPRCSQGRSAGRLLRGLRCAPAAGRASRPASWTDFSKERLSQLRRINPLAADIPQNITYRGSQVLLGVRHHQAEPADAPKTWADLVAWIKANPGQFIYNRPDKGGSGGNFVLRAIYEANGRDPSHVHGRQLHARRSAKAMLEKGFDLLKDIAPSLMDQGAYTSGNTQSIQLLTPGRRDHDPGVVRPGAVGDRRRACCRRPPASSSSPTCALAGGFTQKIVSVNGVNKALAHEAADFILSDEIQRPVITELGGFPGVSWDYVSQELHDKYKPTSSRARSRPCRAATGTRTSRTAGTATSRRTWTARPDKNPLPRLRQATAVSRRSRAGASQELLLVCYSPALAISSMRLGRRIPSRP